MSTIKTTVSTPHPAYQNSRVAWIGDVPEQWKVVRLKNICGFQYGDSLPEEERISTGVPVYGSNGLIGYTHTANTKPKCLIIGRKGSSGKVIYSDEAGFAIDTTFFIDRRHTTSHTKWLYYLLNALDLESLSGDVGVPGLNRTTAYQQICPLPPLDEQAAIVRYLDDADQRIRAYVSAKERLIALLEEERQAVIHQAVTRGLDPDVRLKPSGVEWLGDVPENWEMRRLKQVSTIQGGITLGKDYGDAELIECPYLRVANVQSGHLDLSEITTVQVPLAEVKKTTLEIGDVLMTEGGDIDKLGRGCMWQGEIPGCLHQNHVFAVRPNPTDLNPAFLVALMGTVQGRNYFHATAKQTTNLAATNRTTLGEFPMCLPSIREQQAIVDHITRESSARDASIERASRQIELMEEYRTRLIADVVTGKIDVSRRINPSEKRAAIAMDLGPEQGPDKPAETRHQFRDRATGFPR